MLMGKNYKNLVCCVASRLDFRRSLVLSRTAAGNRAYVASEPGLTRREKRLANPVRSVCLLMDFSWLIIQRHFIVQRQI